MRSNLRRALTFVACLFSLSLSPLAAPWPQWRGPDGQGVSPESKLPSEWAPDKNITWKTPIPGRGHSSPVVWNDRVFLTTDIEGDTIPGAAPAKHAIEGKPFVHPDSVGGNRHHTMKVLALDARSGKILWEQTAYAGAVYDDRHKRGSYASPTPVTDGRRVFAYFGSEGVYAYDVDGKPLWKASVGKIATLGMGVATSPVLHRDLIILQCDDDEGAKSFIVALDASTGRERWRQPRKVQVSWATPAVRRVGSRTELVTNGTELIIAYDPATGKELWQVKGVESNAIHTPLLWQDMVFLTAGFPAKRTIAIVGSSEKAGEAPRIAWQYDKGTAYVASGIAYGDYIYLITDKGILSCLDPRTGDVKYDNGRVPTPASFMASPVAFDGKLLITSVEGETFVIKAGPQHEVLQKNSVGEPVMASLAIADGSIYIRGEQHLFKITAG